MPRAVLGHDRVKDGERIRWAVRYLPEHGCPPPDVSAAGFVMISFVTIQAPEHVAHN